MPRGKKSSNFKAGAENDGKHEVRKILNRIADRTSIRFMPVSGADPQRLQGKPLITPLLRDTTTFGRRGKVISIISGNDRSSNEIFRQAREKALLEKEKNRIQENRKQMEEERLLLEELVIKYNEITADAERLILVDSLDIDGNEPLTSERLEQKVLPFIRAIVDIQDVFDEMDGDTSSQHNIRFITHFSPIEVGIEKVKKAVSFINEHVLPFKQKHVEEVAHLNEREKQVDILLKEALIRESEARTLLYIQNGLLQSNQMKSSFDMNDIEKILQEKLKISDNSVVDSQKDQELERLKIENDRLKFEFQREVLDYILNWIDESLPPEERLTYAMKLLGPFMKLIRNQYELQ